MAAIRDSPPSSSLYSMTMTSELRRIDKSYGRISRSPWFRALDFNIP